MYRLPKNIIPLKYRIYIEPIDQTHFIGSCSINFFCEVECNSITLNCHSDINITSVHVREYNTALKSQCSTALKSQCSTALKSHVPSNVIRDNDTQQITFNFGRVPKTGVLILHYDGKIYDEVYGLTRSGSILYTQFESINARRCFPCFDEPIYRSTFIIEILADSNLTVLSNSREKYTKEIIDKSNQSNKTLHVFEKTLPMPTYLVAFYIGNIPQTIISSPNNVKIGIVSTKTIKFKKFILEHAIKCIDIMEKFCGVPYPLPKLDILYIPHSKVIGMENWGLIIIGDFPENSESSESSKSCESSESSESSEVDLFSMMEHACILAHEISHQWLGDTIVIKWWSELWLTESFANWLETYIISKLYPEWGQWEIFFSKLENALVLDSLPNSCPVVYLPSDQNSIILRFNSIVYTKGGIIIQMLVNYLGMDTFVKGIQHYVKKFYLKNVDTIDFLECMQEVSGVKIFDFMWNWLYRRGYPIINVTSGVNEFKLSQKPFGICSNERSTSLSIFSSPPTSWQFPTKTFQIPLPIGFYLVNYDNESLEKILSANLSNLELAILLNNIFASWVGGRMNFIEYLYKFKIIIKKFPIPSWILTKMLSKHYQYFLSIISERSIIGAYENILIPYVSRVMNVNGLYSEKSMVSMDRMKSSIYAFEIMCNSGKYLDYCVKIVDEYIGGHTSSSTIVDIAIKTVIRSGDREVFDFFYKISNIGTIIGTITFTPHIDNYFLVLELVHSNKLKNSDKINLLNLAGENIKMNSYLWQYLKNNWEYIGGILRKMEGTHANISNIFKYMVDDGELIDDINSFFSDKNKNILAQVKIGVDYIRMNTCFLVSNYDFK